MTPGGLHSGVRIKFGVVVGVGVVDRVTIRVTLRSRVGFGSLTGILVAIIVIVTAGLGLG